MIDPRPLRRLAAVSALLLAALLAATAHAAADDPAALAFEDAARLALDHQPLIEAQAQAVQAAREAAVAAGQLPDPSLIAGVSDLTLAGSERYTLRRESDTQFQLGLKQMFPGGDKRPLRQRRGEQEALRLASELQDQQRQVQREAGLAWLQAWKASQAQRLVKASEAEAERQIAAVDIAYRAGRANQAELIAARVALELLRDQRSGLEQEEWHARNLLRRWIGDDAERLLCPELPDWPAPGAEADPGPALLGIEQHPHIATQSRMVEAAETELQLAQAERRPDWSVQALYGHRPAFADYASLQFEIGLPLFARNRQDRGIAAKAANLGAAEQRREDLIRQHLAELELNRRDWQQLQTRLARYEQLILPQAALRVQAALRAYAAGTATLNQLLEARRALLEMQMQRLALQLDAARHQVALIYFAHVETTHPAAENQP